MINGSRLSLYLLISSKKANRFVKRKCLAWLSYDLLFSSYAYCFYS